MFGEKVMNTRYRKGLWLVTMILIMLIMVACSNQTINNSSASGKYPKKIVLGYQVSPNGELLAKARGSLEKKYPNIKIEWVKFDNGRDVNNAIASGSIDFGLVGTPPAVIGIANKLPYKIYYLHDVIGTSEALVVKDNSGIKNLKYLHGKTIATTFGSTSHFSLLGALKKEGLDPIKEKIKIIDMQPPDIVAAWQRGEIDGAYIWQPTQSKLIEDKGKVIIHSGELAKEGIITAEMGIVRNDFAKEYPQIVKGYISVLDESVKFYHKHPEDAAKYLSKELGLTPKDSLKTMRQIVWLDGSKQKEFFDGQLANILKDTADFLVEQKDITRAPSIEEYRKALFHQ